MIGVYDSGFGGLSVLRALRARMPGQDFCYLGDSGRAPYGGRDAEAILDLAEQCVERLAEEGCRVIVVACHTVSCVGLRHLQQRYGPELRVLGVTIPAAEAAVAQTPSGGEIVWIGTARTTVSRTWEAEIHKLDPRIAARGVAAPLLAPMVEDGLADPDAPEGAALVRGAIRRYLRGAGLLDPALPERTFVLGCTHYPLLRWAFEAELPGARLLDPAPVVAERLEDWLRRHPGFADPPHDGPGRIAVLCTGDPAAFARQGARFLGEPLPSVLHIREEGGRLAHRDHAGPPTGQVLRGGIR